MRNDNKRFVELIKIGINTLLLNNSIVESMYMITKDKLILKLLLVI